MTTTGRTTQAAAMSRRETWAWYTFAFVTYVAGSLGEKALLNWVLGPAWVVVVLTGGPLLWRRIRRR